MVMSIITCGYLGLILSDLFLHINIMYMFIPYALITLVIIEYTRKRSQNYAKYFIGFELELTASGHLLKFFIFTFNNSRNNNSNDSNSKNSQQNKNPVVLKYYELQTSSILDLDQVKQVLNQLGYILIIPYYVAELNSQVPFYKVVHMKEKDTFSISEHYYDDILPRYRHFKAAVINSLNQLNLFNQGSNNLCSSSNFNNTDKHTCPQLLKNNRKNQNNQNNHNQHKNDCNKNYWNKPHNKRQSLTSCLRR